MTKLFTSYTWNSSNWTAFTSKKHVAFDIKDIQNLQQMEYSSEQCVLLFKLQVSEFKRRRHVLRQTYVQLYRGGQKQSRKFALRTVSPSKKVCVIIRIEQNFLLDLILKYSQGTFNQVIFCKGYLALCLWTPKNNPSINVTYVFSSEWSVTRTSSLVTFQCWKSMKIVV